MQKIKQQDQKCLLASTNPLKTFNLTFLCYCKLMSWFLYCVKFKPKEKTTLQVGVKVIGMVLKFLMWQKCPWAQTIPPVEYTALDWTGKAKNFPPTLLLSCFVKQDLPSSSVSHPVTLHKFTVLDRKNRIDLTARFYLMDNNTNYISNIPFDFHQVIHGQKWQLYIVSL